jgi:hypothetical protein
MAGFPSSRSGQRMAWLWAALLVVVLNGCYRSRIGVIEQGERAPVSGSFQCVYSDRDGGFQAIMTEKVVGKGRHATYSYLDVDGRSYKLARQASGLYLVQTGNEGGDYEYAFVDFAADGAFTVLVTPGDGQWPAIRERLRALGIAAHVDGPVVGLRGRPDRLRAFFAAQDRATLRESSRCRPG